LGEKISLKYNALLFPHLCLCSLEEDAEVLTAPLIDSLL